MDGNGRWAKKRMLPRSAGHRQGVKALAKIIERCKQLGIKCLTVYAFSTENFNRDKAEVDNLFQLLKEYFVKNKAKFVKNGIKVCILGEKNKFPVGLQELFCDIEIATDGCDSLVFNIALGYSGRDEIVSACKVLCSSGKEISADNISKTLYTSHISDPELIIRTSGEMRISNFLLWQCAYSEFYFCDTLWPDFTSAELDRALAEYAGRSRRFGGV